MSTPREEFTEASRKLTQAQGRLDADRRYLNTQRRVAARAFPFASQLAQRDAHLNEPLVAVRQGIARVNEAKELRTQRYEALVDKTEADGWL